MLAPNLVASSLITCSIFLEHLVGAGKKRLRSRVGAVLGRFHEPRWSKSTLDTLSTGRSEGLTRLGFCAKLIQSISDLEPRGFEVDEDVALRSNSWIVFEGPSRNANDLPIDDGHRSATNRAECASVPWRPIAHWSLVGLDQ